MSRYAKINRIKSLSANPEELLKELAVNYDTYSDSIYTLRDTIKAAGPAADTPEFREFVSYAVLQKFMSKVPDPPKNPWGNVMKLNTEYSNLLEIASPYLLPGAKMAAVDMVSKYHKNFYSHVRKRIVNTCCDLVEKDSPLAKELFVNFYRVLDKQRAKTLLDKIPDKDKVGRVNKILSKSKHFLYRKYDNTGILSDLDKRQALMKDLASSPTLCKKIPMTRIEVRKKDLENLPPVTRFNFMRYLFDMKIRTTKNYMYSSTDPKRYFRWVSRLEGGTKVQPEILKVSEVKDLLFPIALQKNKVVANWVAGYEKFIAKMIAMKEVDKEWAD